MLSMILGKKHLREEDSSLIPDDAKELSAGTLDKAGGVDKAKLTTQTEQPAASNKQDLLEPLIPPSIALVAPDVTPDQLVPLDPSQVPMPAAPVTPDNGQQLRPQSPSSMPALKTLLNVPPEEAYEDQIQQPAHKIANIMESAMTPGVGMPDPVKQDPQAAGRLFKLAQRFRGTGTDTSS